MTTYWIEIILHCCLPFFHARFEAGRLNFSPPPGVVTVSGNPSGVGDVHTFGFWPGGMGIRDVSALSVPGGGARGVWSRSSDNVLVLYNSKGLFVLKGDR